MTARGADPSFREQDSAQRQHVAAADRAVERRLWFGIIAAPTVWTAAELAGYALVGRSCGAATTGLESWRWIVLVVLQVVSALVAGAGAWIAYRAFRRSTGAVGIMRAEGWTRVEFMAIAGVIISTFLLLNIVYFGVMPFIVNPCLRIT